MKGITLAWLAGIGLMAWRDAQEYHKPPVPGRLLGASLVFAGLALIAEAGPNAARAAALTAWAFDLAVLFQVGPQALTSTAGFGGPGSVNRPPRPRTENTAATQGSVV